MVNFYEIFSIKISFTMKITLLFKNLNLTENKGNSNFILFYFNIK